MQVATLSINYANLKNDIEGNYLAELDSLFKLFVITLCTYDKSIASILPTTIMENEKYYYFMIEVRDAMSRGEDPLSLITTPKEMQSFSDMSVYCSEFIASKHNPKMMNVYNLTIDQRYHCVITRKTVGKNVH